MADQHDASRLCRHANVNPGLISPLGCKLQSPKILRHISHKAQASVSTIGSPSSLIGSANISSTNPSTNLINIDHKHTTISLWQLVSPNPHISISSDQSNLGNLSANQPGSTAAIFEDNYLESVAFHVGHAPLSFVMVSRSYGNGALMLSKCRGQRFNHLRATKEYILVCSSVSNYIPRPVTSSHRRHVSQ
jgi:hypothetical protein